MKEHPILFSTPMVSAIIEGRKSMTRRLIKPQPEIIMDVRTTGILVAYTSIKELGYEKINIQTDSRISERRLHGWERWQDLLKDEIQRVWSEGLRGLVCITRLQKQEGVFDCIVMPQQRESNEDSSQFDMHGIPRPTATKVHAGEALGQQPGEQSARKFEVGYSTGKLGRSRVSRKRHERGKTPHEQIDQQGAGSYSLVRGKKHCIAKAYCKDIGNVTIRYSKSRFEVGDVLWVRESWVKNLNQDSQNFNTIEFKADYIGSHAERLITWKPSIHMPKEACRLRLKITDIGVERLQDISEEDAIMEGVLTLGSGWVLQQFPAYSHNYKDWLQRKEGGVIERPPLGPSPTKRFESLWHSIYGEESWSHNPFVWCISFEKLSL